MVFAYWFPRNRCLFLFGFIIRGDGDGVGVANVNSPNDWLIDGVIGVPTLDRLICEQLVSGGASSLSLVDGGL